MENNLKELLKNGVFVKASDSELSNVRGVVVKDKIIWQHGGFDYIRDLDEDLCFTEDYKIDVILQAFSFDNVDTSELIIWERKMEGSDDSQLAKLEDFVFQLQEKIYQLQEKISQLECEIALS